MIFLLKKSKSLPLQGSILMSASVNEGMMVAGRILLGIGGGTCTVVVPMYLNEISPAKYRGAIGVLTQLAFCVGLSISQILGLFLSYVPGWRWLVSVGALVSLIQMALLPFCVQSPKVLSFVFFFFSTSILVVCSQ